MVGRPSQVQEVGKVVLRNRMTRDMVAATHGKTCVVTDTMCCAYIPDNDANIACFKPQEHIQDIGHLNVCDVFVH